MSIAISDSCIYCGGDAFGVSRGEHIVPQAIGGAVTISDICKGRLVCNRCNNGILSQIDKELCSRSLLSVIASQEINAHLWQVWDVDHQSNQLLLEARPDWTRRSLVLFPQVIFEKDGPEFHGDLEQMRRFGAENFQRVMFAASHRAFSKYRAGAERWLHHERIDRNQLTVASYRFPPRLFWRGTIEHLGQRVAARQRAGMILRYCRSADARRAMMQLSNLNSDKVSREYGIGLGSRLPAVASYSDAGKTLRALFKISLNFIAAYCAKTPVNQHQFSTAIDMVMGRIPVTPRLLNSNGIVQTSDLHALHNANGAHVFRLLHIDGAWNCYLSFFGGKLSCFTKFPGPNLEDWRTIEVIVPIQSKAWTVTTSRLLQPIPVRIAWRDPQAIRPSVELLNGRIESRIVQLGP